VRRKPARYEEQALEEVVELWGVLLLDERGMGRGWGKEGEGREREGEGRERVLYARC
jgi:hypothetical protein